MKKCNSLKLNLSLFKEHLSKNPSCDLLSLFDEWCSANNIFGIDKHELWKRARKLGKRDTLIIKETSEEDIRLKAVLDILLEADLKTLHKLLEKRGEA